MTASTPTPKPNREPRLVRLGRWSYALLRTIWLELLGIVALGTISGIVVPLIIAVVVGTFLEPVIRLLRRFHVPATLATVLPLLLVVLAAIGLVAVVISESPLSCRGSRSSSQSVGTRSSIGAEASTSTRSCC